MSKESIRWPGASRASGIWARLDNADGAVRPAVINLIDGASAKTLTGDPQGVNDIPWRLMLVQICSSAACISRWERRYCGYALCFYIAPVTFPGINFSFCEMRSMAYGYSTYGILTVFAEHLGTWRHKTILNWCKQLHFMQVNVDILTLPILLELVIQIVYSFQKGFQGDESKLGKLCLNHHAIRLSKIAF